MKPHPAFRRLATTIIRTVACLSVLSLSLLCAFRAQAEEDGSLAVILPNGVKAVWDITQAVREKTPTRERICVNGLWRWQPAQAGLETIPTNSWGYYKVPACWPGIRDYMQNDYQTLYAHPDWNGLNLSDVRAAWYQREISIPTDWAGRRIVLDLEYLNSYAAVYLDGKPAGEVRFPGGEVELTSLGRPGQRHVLSVYVAALPLKAVMESYNDTNRAKERKGTVERRGFCGDVWLVGEPAGPRLSNPRVFTSFRKSQITPVASLRGLATEHPYRLRAVVTRAKAKVAEFTSPPFHGHELTNAEASFAAAWKAPELWDIHTPQNQYEIEISLLNEKKQLLDVGWPVRFGFREFWAEGRDFYLNGTRIYLSMVPLDNAQVGAALSTYDAAKETLLRLKSFGINFVYTHNYNCEPGAHLSFSEILRAADDTGMLVALTQPHFSAYDWSDQADQTNGYALHAAFYAQVAGSHPSVVCYSMSHNGAGYNEDMNPQKMGSSSNPRDQWSQRNAARALRCEAIVHGLDPSRVIYHHSAGDLSAAYTINFYPNFVPRQELDDWFEHWSQSGTKPMMLVEYGAPFGWDWTMYRGWYEGHREFGSAAVPWEYCLAEWNAQFLGDAAYRISDREKADIRWEASQFRQGRTWFRWDYPYPVGDGRLLELQPVQADYTKDNWRAFRTWGLSGNSPWEHDRFWKLRDGFQHHRQELAVDWDHLQRPGYSPDYIDKTYESFALAYERSDWVALPAAEELIRNNGPVLSWMAGKPEHFTAKDHVYNPGEKVEKQFIVINNSRVTIQGAMSWSSDIGHRLEGAKKLKVPTGEQARVPVQFIIPKNATPGNHQITAKFKIDSGEEQQDTFSFEVVRRPALPHIKSRVALFDPLGESSKVITDLGIKFLRVDASDELTNVDVLLIGKKALTVDGPAPNLQRVRDGLKVVVFEQTSEVLEKRLGFRVEEYGLRQAWPRVPDSPLLQDLTARSLSDWRGASTLLSPSLDYTLSPKYNGAPTVRWCGLEVTRLWRCGNWGNVASVLIEKPQRGDFLPIVDGGYALEYSPLLEYREGAGMVLFCQMDITGRTEEEPGAKTLARNILSYVDNWQPTRRRMAVYAGNAAGLEWLATCAIKANSLSANAPADDQLLILGRTASKSVADPHIIREWVAKGGRVLALGLDQNDASVLPDTIKLQTGEHIASWFSPFGVGSMLAGVSPADVHNRDPRAISLVTQGAEVYGDGVLAETTNIVFCQLPPFDVCEPKEVDTVAFNRRRTFARTSVLVSRLLGNLGISGSTPLLERFSTPVVKEPSSSQKDGRWVEGLYLTHPKEWDDPYRFFRW